MESESEFSSSEQSTPSVVQPNNSNHEESRIFSNTREVAPALGNAIVGAVKQIGREITQERSYVDQPSSVRRLALVAAMSGLTAAAIVVDTLELAKKSAVSGVKRLWQALKSKEDETQQEKQNYPTQVRRIEQATTSAA